MAYKTLVQLAAEINADITANGAQGITGTILNALLIDMKDSLMQGPNGGTLANRIPLYADATGQVLVDSGVLFTDMTTDAELSASLVALLASLTTLYQPLSARLSALAALAGVTAGDLFYFTAANSFARLAIGNNGDGLVVTGGVPVWAAGGTLWPNRTLNGLELSRPTTTTFGIAVGQARNEDGGTAYNMQILSAWTKGQGAWAVGTGNGGIDTGAVAASTRYHVHMIRKDSDGSIDFLYSLSATAPTMPGGYTARRRIGSLRTDAGSLFVQFSQNGDEVLFDAAVVERDDVNPGTAAITRALTSVPLGVKTIALLNVGTFGGTSANVQSAVTSLDVSDQAPQVGGTGALTGFSTGNNIAATSQFWNWVALQVRTDLSAQVRARLSVSGAADRLGIVCRGYIDARGK